MTNTTVKAREIELKDLETVSGGTVGEFEELIEAYTTNPYLSEACGLVCGHIPGVNNGMAAFVESILEDRLGIEADISLGFAGTGIGSPKHLLRQSNRSAPDTPAGPRQDHELP
jgi:hypothetical protein